MGLESEDLLTEELCLAYKVEPELTDYQKKEWFDQQ